jgi:hypothetical protein
MSGIEGSLGEPLPDLGGLCLKVTGQFSQEDDIRLHVRLVELKQLTTPTVLVREGGKVENET